MRHLVVLTSMLALLVPAARADEQRSACVTACEATAQTCLYAAHGKYDACKPATRKTCAPRPPSEMFDCMTTAMKACARTHSAEVEPCRGAFASCYAACGSRPAGQVEFWCDLDADPPAGDAKLRKEALCSGTPGQPGEKQWEACMARFKPADSAASFSLACDPLP